VTMDKSEKKIVECEAKKEGDKIEKLIDASSILRNSKCQLLMDGDKPQVIPYYVKLPYPHSVKIRRMLSVQRIKVAKSLN